MGFNLIATDNAGLPAFLQEMGGYQDEGLSAGIQARAPKIGISIDKHFTVTRDGVSQVLETVMTDNNGNKHAVPVQSLRCVVIAASQTLTKAWYESAYVPGSNAAPECYSNDGKTPAPGVAKPQCASCAQCSKNAFGSNPTTGRGKACADRKMLVVAWEGAPDELMTWNVSTTSLNSLAKFNQELRNANIPMQSVLVELVFDPTITYPVVKISPVGFVDKETFLKFKDLSQTDEVASLLREVDYEPAMQNQSPVPQNTIAFGQQQMQGAAQGAAQQQAPVQEQAPAQEKPKRARRTQAQIEADRLAAAGQQPAQQQQQGGHEIQLEQPLEQIKEEAAQVLQQPQEDVVAKLQAQLAAALAAQQTQQVQPQQAVEQAAQQVQQQTAPVQQQSAPAAQTAQPSGNVANLLATWASKKQ